MIIDEITAKCRNFALSKTKGKPQKEGIVLINKVKRYEKD